MKNPYSRVAMLAAVLSAVAAPSRADLSATVALTDSYGDSGGAGHGGEFLAAYSGFDFTPATLSEVAGHVEVFCVERSEFVSFGTPYFVEINTAAVNGGIGGGSPDPLNVETAYLYNQFVTRNLVGYDYDDTGVGRTASANAAQNVIWFFEDELEGNSYRWGLTAQEAELAREFYQQAIATDWTNVGEVRIMNLYMSADRTGHRQDQLVMAVAPAPGSTFLAVLGLALCVAVRKRSGARA